MIYERHAHDRPTCVTTFMGPNEIGAKCGGGIAPRFRGSAHPRMRIPSPALSAHIDRFPLIVGKNLTFAQIDAAMRDSGYRNRCVDARAWASSGS